MLCRALYCYGRLSVCPSVTLRYRGHVGWNTLRIISRLISLRCSLSTDSNITDLLQREHPEIPGGIGVERRVDNARHCVVTYLQFYIRICFYALNVNTKSKSRCVQAKHCIARFPCDRTAFLSV